MWTKGQPLGDVARSPISIFTENKLYSSLSVLPARSLAKRVDCRGDVVRVMHVQGPCLAYMAFFFWFFIFVTLKNTANYHQARLGHLCQHSN